MSEKIWERNKINVDDIFSCHVELDVMHDNEDHKPKSMEQRQKWKDVKESELKSLVKKEVFGAVVRTPEGVQPLGYK